MTVAKLQVGQNQFLVQVEVPNAGPIEVPMLMGFLKWQYQSNKKIKIKGATLPDLVGNGPHVLYIENETYNFKPWRLLRNKWWEGTATLSDD